MLAHKIRFYPNREQEQILFQSCGVARFSYNWGLSKWKEMYKKKEKPTLNKVKTEFNNFKKENEEYSWLYNVSKCSPEYALMDLDNAFKRFFKKETKHPVFKKKKVGKGSFSVANDKFWVKDNICMIPKVGKVELSEKLRFTGKIMKGTISFVSNKWFISVTVKAKKKKANNKNIVGIDLGIKDTLILSTGEKYNLPNLEKLNKKVKRKQRLVSRKVKGSKNRFRAVIKLQNEWDKLLNKKKDWIEKVTTAIAKKYRFIALENLNIKGMMKNRKLSAKFQQIGLYSIIEKLKTKANVLQINRFFPSSKLCSFCNYKKEDLSLSDRFWTCPDCNTEHDRDINAAINILLKAIEEVKSVDKKALALVPCLTGNYCETIIGRSRNSNKRLLEKNKDAEMIVCKNIQNLTFL